MTQECSASSSNAGVRPPRGKPSEEEIARIRAERKAKREAAALQGAKSDIPAELRFIERPMLSVHPDGAIGAEGNRLPVTLMTYNCLAQALIRRKLFPDSGPALKWYRRSQVLLNKFKHYEPDVLCLQEVDAVQWHSFWRGEFEKLGYAAQFHKKQTKNHGVAVVWRSKLFTMADKMLIDFDKEQSGDVPPRTTTNNAGLVIALKFTEQALTGHRDTPRSGILVGTTHLFWHPFGTFERTRQCYVVLNKMKEFMHRVNVLQNENDGNNQHWFPFFCGDFNSQPYDAPYLSMTSKPVSYSGRARTVIECSTSYTFSKQRDGEDAAADEEEEGGNIEIFGKDQPHHPVPATFEPNAEQCALVHQMETLHNSLDMRAVSLYSVGYRNVHPENAGADNARGEPEISNWAHTWNGLLDYLFYVGHWDFKDRTGVDTLEEFEQDSGVTVKRLLRMPSKQEMQQFGHGQPHTGEYPSDHLAMVCDLELAL
ncbi:RNA exonuclease KNAG_0K00650 [Huiozyma naganishii CBS 8797]|uniref:Endonuclease/exonuclease/phosphatase domain-containing protein n=1 Tax=Huiozyma naganishii (strain ATCC MYA-139 / BCRC 22969 / CBS 8797 / KCTC 17520 / NBRC 10181 / NCYC 3082 / Yp74L-3) TaxID=1071383 RepID=J7RRE5_HUIN7|nr:hypothetical protein KNAG_0K00650 [Kazachstania naganishii CBS 8797]CCK72433.1 hypothetical protein KNAG_0K00650 [Kazachstania naganishii CBS 8797]